MFVEELKNTQEWKDFLRANPGTFYHSLKWRDVLQKSFSIVPVYLVIKGDDGRLIGICPTFVMPMSHMRVLNSLPYSDFGGPIIEKEFMRVASLSLQEFIVEYCRKKGISYAKICFSKDGCERFFKSFRYYSDNSSKGIVGLDLSTHPSAFIWEKIFRKKHRKKIRRFEQYGFHVREASTRSDLMSFLTCYYQNMKHIGAPAYPPTFFESVWDTLHLGNFDILILEGRNTAGGLAFYEYGSTIYLTYLGIDRDLLSTLPRAYSVAPFLYWESIKWAEENGFRHVCFGSTPANPKSESDRANYTQKAMFGGSFQLQETVSIPFDASALAILLFGSRIIKTWKTVRSVLPRRLRNTIEDEFGMF